MIEIYVNAGPAIAIVEIFATLGMGWWMLWPHGQFWK